MAFLILFSEAKVFAATYECGKDGGNIIEITKDQITIIDDAIMPVGFRLDGVKREASTELKHFAYVGSRRAERIEVNADILTLSSGKKSSATYVYEIAAKDQLLAKHQGITCYKMN